MKELLESYPFNAFPVIETGVLKGILTRAEIKEAVNRKEKPNVHEAGVCFSNQTVKEVGNKFIDYHVQVLVVKDPKTDTITGIITLHDLIRAQSATQS